MRARTVPKIKPAVIFLVALSLPGAALAARQTATPSTAAKPSTSKKVITKRPVRKRKPRQRAQAAPTPARISQIQAALASQGNYKGQPNGKWDATTIQAMKDYQSAHGLTATGKLDALTLQKLGLGSEIAGRAAPLPVPQTQGVPATNDSQQTP
jgi:peptidoglycan hydrolase-like protein with peptidoglycan-binding domain